MQGLLLQLYIDTACTAHQVGITVDTTSDADETIGGDTASSEVIQHCLATETRETLVLSSISIGGRVTRKIELHLCICREDAVDFVERKACFGKELALAQGKEDLALEVGDDRDDTHLYHRLRHGYWCWSWLLDNHLRRLKLKLRLLYLLWWLLRLLCLSCTQSYELFLDRT